MIVVIGDIIGSRELEEDDRERVQSLLLNQLDRINNQSESILSPFTITLGDEFQAVYANASGLWEDCWKIMAHIHPVSVRFSVSIGAIVTSINKKQALGMDGPAFHGARDGIEDLKKTGRLFSLRWEPEDEETERQALLKLMNSSLKLLSNEMKSWKKIRFQILVRMNRDVPVKKIARELDISETAVYKNREDGDLALVIELKNSIETLMNNELTRITNNK